MKSNQTPLKRLGMVMSTSSETFMLVALIGLFSIPFVIASNLEPIVKQSETNRPSEALVIPNSVEESTQVAAVNPTTAEQQVLGVQTSTTVLNILPSSMNLKFFEKNLAQTTEKNYVLELGTNQVFGKMSLFTLRNDSATKQTYKFNLENLGQDTTSLVLFIDNLEYRSVEGKLPDYVNLDVTESVTFYAMNTEKNTDMKITVEVIDSAAVQ
jgi:hypothetical protein